MKDNAEALLKALTDNWNPTYKYGSPLDPATFREAMNAAHRAMNATKEESAKPKVKPKARPKS